MSGRRKIDPDGADHVPRNEQRQRHQDQRERGAPAAFSRHDERDRHAERHLDQKHQAGEHELPEQRVVQPRAAQHLAEPVGADEGAVGRVEDVLDGVVHHRHQRDERH